MGRSRIARGAAAALAVACMAGAAGCATVAEHRKLERDVRALQRAGDTTGAPSERERLAELGARLDAIERELGVLSGRVEVTEHRVEEAVREAQRARSEAAASGPGPATPAGGAGASPADDAPAEARGASAREVEAYRAAYSAWRDDDAQACVDRFRNFLQTYASSSYADDAAYWLADCYFKSGDYKTAVLRFDDVVVRYPSGGKAADALYRQGEALLRMGPGYGKAAGKAFERVIQEYPDSGRVPEARRQLDLLGAG